MQSLYFIKTGSIFWAMQGLEHSDSLKYEFIAIPVCYDDNHPQFVICLEYTSLYIFMYGWGIRQVHIWSRPTSCRFWTFLIAVFLVQSKWNGQLLLLPFL